MDYNNSIINKWYQISLSLINKHRMYQFDSIICLLQSKNKKLKEDLDFYKSIFKTHQNSAVFNLRIKYINKERLWVDKVKIRSEYQLLNLLDKDDEVIEWLTPIRCER